jgi:exonuclease SbcC
MQQVKEEAAQQLSRKNHLTEIHMTLNAHTQTLKALQKKLSHYAGLEEQERDLVAQTRSHQEEIKKLLKRQEELVGEHARLALRQETLAVLEKECAEERSRLTTLDELAADFQALALATGKDGIQALIIEQALPEIENEANTLLSRLTNNQAHITIESLRDLKKGGSKETLDINISDSLGVRPYELYSGGEAFRIDFAIRIAISKLLARRAGTSLQTLIIDEGFGSQDEEGLSKIMEAIYAIQDDFAKIIIVSHLTSMKDQFPVHLMIEKEPSGSKVHVFQQG